MRNKVLITGLLGSLLWLGGCNGSKGTQSDSGGEQPQEVQPKSDVDGVVVAGIATDKAQLLKASASGGLAGTEVIFPAGALAIATDVTLAEGATLDLSASKSELGIDETVQVAAASSTILITVAETQDLLKPVTVTTTLSEGVSLAPQGTKYALLSHVTKAGAATIMIDANLDFKVDGNKISFPINFFGAHGVVLVPEDFGETKEAPTARPLPDKKGADNTVPDPTTNALTVASMTPAAGAKVALPASVELTFSAAIDSATATSAVTVSRGNAPVSGSISVSGAKVLFSPAQSFIIGQSYTVAVATTLKSSTGSALTAAYTASFTVNDGAWSTTSTAVGVETTGNYASLSALTAGRFGITRTAPSTSIDTYLFDGTEWGAKATFSDANVGEFQSVRGAGGVDGRFYILGEHSSKAYIMRYNPALSAPKLLTDGIDPAPTGMNNQSVVTIGQGEALYFYQFSGQMYARSLKGDVLGAVETAAPIASYPYPVTTGSVHGAAAIAGVVVANGKNALKIYRRAPSGTWSDLTPNGNELTDDLVQNPYRVVINSGGNPIVFWCINDLTEANTCSLSMHNGTSWSTAKTFISVSTVYSPDFFCDDTASACTAVWHETDAGNYNIYAAVYKNGTWAAPAQIGTATNGYAKVGMDRAGRILVIWANSDSSLKFVRYNGSTWSPDANAVTSGVSQLYSLAIDQSGGAMAMIKKETAVNTFGLHTVSFK